MSDKLSSGTKNPKQTNKQELQFKKKITISYFNTVKYTCTVRKVFNVLLWMTHRQLPDAKLFMTSISLS